MEGCSETEIIKFEKLRCLQALFGLGAASGPRDFKSAVSTCSTIAAYSIPPMEGCESWRDVLEGCSKTKISQIQKVGCLQAQFGLGAAFGPRDFKSRVSTYSTTAAYSP